jgi:hypothetical protein
MKPSLNKLLDAALTRKGVKGKSGVHLNAPTRIGALRRVRQNLKGSDKATLNNLRFLED